MTMMRPTVALSTLALLAAPALAVAASKSDNHLADMRLEHQRLVTARAAESGDVATIAEERAKLNAARAVAWGRRHPAKAPTDGVAAR